ncbi:helix-turn-helix domain-containing protein [Lactobacillus crispatus]|uniref:helix-turn-helix domain-containing protein n=1 Tax=Lactobacillus crispatus TaxID=47770 RepID=UPI000C7A0782|nr:helix-turn-helix transcriptional regulator [Lactobacillus crispatus]PKZ86240.1 XRE family transcriptional regulator [Lactobacillus crispatus]
MSKSIGEVLKEERRSLGLTQEQFIKGIISESFYSKVERGKNEIVAVDLLKILAANNISEEEFLSKLNVKENNNLEEDLKVQLLNAYSIHDKKKIRMLVQKIQNAAMDENTKISARLIDAVVNNKINDLTQREITQIKRKFFEVDDWTKNITTLQLFCNSMLLFDFDELVLFVKKMKKTCKGKLMKLPFNTQKIIASICINYFHNPDLKLKCNTKC